MKRREFITLLGNTALAWPLAAHAQQPAMPVIGVLWPGQTPPGSPRMESFTQALRQLGFTEGQNVSIELRYARGGLQQVVELAAELVRLKVDVIATFGDLTPKIAQQATRTIPIVAISDDILGAGLVESLSRPGANTTGLTIMAPELSAKRLEVLQEMVPKMSRVAALWDPTTGASQVEMTERAAQSLNLSVQVLEVRGRNDVADAFRAALRTVPKRSTFSIHRFSPPFTARSSILPRNPGFPRCTNGKNMWKPEACCRMALALRQCGGRPERLLSKSSKARSLPTFQSNNQPNLSLR